MFGKVIYYDKSTVNDYKAIINGKRNIEIEEYEVSNDRGINADLKFVSADSKSTKAYKARIQESNLYDCDEFEKMLEGREDFFDFTISSIYDIDTIPNKSIIKIDGQIEIPEEFDMVKLVDIFKPLLMGMEQFQNIDETSRVALKSVLENASATKIPLIFDYGNRLLCSKIQQKNLIMEYEELAEIDMDVTVLARIVTPVVNRSKAFYDPLKDFMSLNRMMRKSIENRGEKFNPIYVNSDYRVIEVLAIYR